MIGEKIKFNCPNCSDEQSMTPVPDCGQVVKAEYPCPACGGKIELCFENVMSCSLQETE